MQFPSASSAPKKREVLAKLAKMYDPLSLASPTTLPARTARGCYSVKASRVHQGSSREISHQTVLLD